jgi:hypothetical protein
MVAYAETKGTNKMTEEYHLPSVSRFGLTEGRLTIDNYPVRDLPKELLEMTTRPI